MPPRFLTRLLSLALLPMTSLTAGAAEASNPLFEPSTLPFGYPRFDRIRDEHFAPAFTRGMAEHLREVEAIAAAPAEPTFDNTLVALEKSGDLLGRVQRVFFNLVGAHGNDALRAVEKEMAPKLSAHSDAIRLNPALFARINALHARIDQLGLDPESRRLLERTHRDFVRSGARLGEAEKTRLRSLNAEIASLQTTFAQNVLKETNASAVIVDRREELAGLADAEIAAAGAAAKAAGHDGKFALRLINTSGHPHSARWRTAPSASACTGPRSPAAAAAATSTTGNSSPASPACGPNAPPCSATRATPPISSRSRPPPTSVRSTSCSPTSPPPRWPTPAARRPTCSA